MGGGGVGVNIDKVVLKTFCMNLKIYNTSFVIKILLYMYFFWGGGEYLRHSFTLGKTA